jgi:hypothetical protein
MSALTCDLDTLADELLDDDVEFDTSYSMNDFSFDELEDELLFKIVEEEEQSPLPAI